MEHGPLFCMALIFWGLLSFHDQDIPSRAEHIHRIAESPQGVDRPRHVKSPRELRGGMNALTPSSRPRLFFGDARARLRLFFLFRFGDLEVSILKRLRAFEGEKRRFCKIFTYG